MNILRWTYAFSFLTITQWIGTMQYFTPHLSVSVLNVLLVSSQFWILNISLRLYLYLACYFCVPLSFCCFRVGEPTSVTSAVSMVILHVSYKSKGIVHHMCHALDDRWPLKWKKVTWHVAKYGDPYSEFVLCIQPIQIAHTQQWTHTHTHTPWTHTRSSGAAIYAAVPGEQLGIRCLA